MNKWKDIPGYEKEYQASVDGQIRSIDRSVMTKTGIRNYKGKNRRPQKHSAGYLAVNLRQSEQHLVHRLVAMTFIEKPIDKHFVNHIDGDKTNNNVLNLEWTTRQENEDHAFETGLKNSKGSNNAMAKLTDGNVLSIREMIAKGGKKSDAAKRFNVHKGTIDRVVAKRIWAHI